MLDLSPEASIPRRLLSTGVDRDMIQKETARETSEHAEDEDAPPYATHGLFTIIYDTNEDLREQQPGTAIDSGGRAQRLLRQVLPWPATYCT